MLATEQHNARHWRFARNQFATDRHTTICAQPPRTRVVATDQPSAQDSGSGTEQIATEHRRPARMLHAEQHHAERRHYAKDYPPLEQHTATCAQHPRTRVLATEQPHAEDRKWIKEQIPTEPPLHTPVLATEQHHSDCRGFATDQGHHKQHRPEQCTLQDSADFGVADQFLHCSWDMVYSLECATELQAAAAGLQLTSAALPSYLCN